MRSTKASSAVERLNKRSTNSYSMSYRADHGFSLLLIAESGSSEPAAAPLPLDEFVKFVNGVEPSAPKRISKLDVAFRDKLNKK
jgi:hypothetical protein